MGSENSDRVLPVDVLENYPRLFSTLAVVAILVLVKVKLHLAPFVVTAWVVALSAYVLSRIGHLDRLFAWFLGTAVIFATLESPGVLSRMWTGPAWSVTAAGMTFGPIALGLWLAIPGAVIGVALARCLYVDIFIIGLMYGSLPVLSTWGNSGRSWGYWTLLDTLWTGSLILVLLLGAYLGRIAARLLIANRRVWRDGCLEICLVLGATAMVFAMTTGLKHPLFEPLPRVVGKCFIWMSRP